MNLKLIALVIVAASTLAPTSSWARQVYFTSNAISNVTFEGSPQNDTVDGMGCTWAANTWTCPLPATKCRVMIANTNPTSSQQTVTVSMNYQIMQQSNTTNLTVDPFVNSAPTDLSFTSLISAAAAGWRGTLNSYAALSSVGATTTLSQNQYLIYERYIQPSYTVTSDASKSFITYSQWPYAKWFSTCSATITVTDVATSSPGFVVAHGSHDYYNSSYQNQPVDYGGYNTVSPNALWSKARVSSIYAKSEGGASANCGNGAMLIYTYGYANGTASDIASCSVGISTNTAQKPGPTGNASRNWPLQISQIPILINGGSPF